MRFFKPAFIRFHRPIEWVTTLIVRVCTAFASKIIQDRDRDVCTSHRFLRCEWRVAALLQGPVWGESNGGPRIQQGCYGAGEKDLAGQHMCS